MASEYRAVYEEFILEKEYDNDEQPTQSPYTERRLGLVTITADRDGERRRTTYPQDHVEKLKKAERRLVDRNIEDSALASDRPRPGRRRRRNPEGRHGKWVEKDEDPFASMFTD